MFNTKKLFKLIKHNLCMRKEVEMYLIAILLLGIVFLFAFFQPGFTGTGYAVFEQPSNFSEGELVNTSLQEGSIILSENMTSGLYVSESIDSGNENTTWNNLNVSINEGEGSLSFEACFVENCSDADFQSLADISSINVTSQYFTYKVLFDRNNESSVTPSLSSVAVEYTIPEEFAIIINSPEDKTYTTSEVLLDVSANEEVDSWWYVLNEGNETSFNDTLTLNLSDGNYSLVVYANNTASGEVNSSVLFVVDTLIYGCTDEDAENYNPDATEDDGECTYAEVEEEPVEEEPQVQEAPKIPRLSLSSGSNLIFNPAQTNQISVSAENVGDLQLTECKVVILEDEEVFDWVSLPGEEVTLNIGDSHEFTFTIDVPEDAETTTYTLEEYVVCAQLPAGIKTETTFEVVPITFEFNLTDVRKIRDDEVRASYDLTDLSGEDQVVDLEFALFDNTSIKISESTDSINLSANESDEFRSIIPINESIEGNLTIQVQANSQKYSESVSEPIVLGGAPFLGFVAFGDVITGTSGAVLLVIVLLALAAIIFVTRRMRKGRGKKDMNPFQ